jgi:6-phosphogluconate dehydrogenase
MKTILFLGLGKMGQPTANRLIDNGYHLITKAHSDKSRATANELGIDTIDEYSELNLDNDSLVWLLVPHEVVDQTIDDMLPYLPKGITIIDAGNSYYKNSIQRHIDLKSKGYDFVDLGTSGGVIAATEGYCLMYGGEQSVVEPLKPVFEILATPNAGHLHCGPAGSGHFVKMVHNGIEYGAMQSLAEGYHLLHDGPFKDLNLGAVGQLWQQGSINQGLLNQLCAEALQNNPELDGIEGVVKKSGEADWTLQTAREYAIAVPSTQTAVDRRDASAAGDIDFSTKLLAAMRFGFGGHDINGK